MRWNPEFQRNIWLELTPHRLISMPIVLGIIFLMTYLLEDSFSEGITITASQGITITATFLFFILVVMWGSKLSSEAITSEIQDKTWDNQRMTTIGPWSMSWAKLFGSTIFTWYGGLLCIAVLTISSSGISVTDSLQRAGIFILAGLLAQSTALYISMVQFMSRRQTWKHSTILGMLLGIILALPFIQYDIPSEDTIQWFGRTYSQSSFIIFSLAFFSGWTIIGTYRLMRKELQLANTPLVWLLFLIILPGYIVGFEENSAHNMGQLNFYLLVIYFTTSLTIYLAILAEPKDPVTFRRLAFQIHHGGGRKILHHIPGWLGGLLLLGLVTLAIAIRDIPITGPYTPPLISLNFFAGFLFIIRDICIFLFFYFSPKPKRANTVSIMYLLLLYTVIPIIFSSLGLEPISAAFSPWSTLKSITIISGLIQSAIMLYLVYHRWNALSDQT